MSVRLTPRSSKVGHYERKEGSEKRSVYWRSPFGAQSVATALDDKCWKRFVAVLWEAEILWAGITAVTIPRAGCKRWTVRERARDLCPAGPPSKVLTLPPREETDSSVGE